jgi:D-aminoacyl-tRNA deacylase
MRAVVQRVKKARVDINGNTVGEIQQGLLVFLGVGEEDSEKDAEYMADKIANLRIFSDKDDLMNLSLLDTGGSALIVSQFTLWGDCRKGRRPSFAKAAKPERAKELYEYFIEVVQKKGLPVATGKFQEMMDVHLQNDGPVTLLLDSAKAF